MWLGAPIFSGLVSISTWAVIEGVLRTDAIRSDVLIGAHFLFNRSRSAPVFLSRVILWDALLLSVFHLIGSPMFFLAVGLMRFISIFTVESIHWSKNMGELRYGRAFLAMSASVWIGLGFAYAVVPRVLLLSPVCRFVKC